MLLEARKPILGTEALPASSVSAPIPRSARSQKCPKPHKQLSRPAALHFSAQGGRHRPGSFSEEDPRHAVVGSVSCVGEIGRRGWGSRRWVDD
jgi:hypothetical protein